MGAQAAPPSLAIIIAAALVALAGTPPLSHAVSRTPCLARRVSHAVPRHHRGRACRACRHAPSLARRVSHAVSLPGLAGTPPLPRTMLRAVRNLATHYTLHTTHYTLHTTHYTLHTTHYTLHTTHYPLHTPCAHRFPGMRCGFRGGGWYRSTWRTGPDLPRVTRALAARYRGTSLIRNRHAVGPYRRTMSRLLWRS